MGIAIPTPKDRTLQFSKGVDQTSTEALVKQILEINDADNELEKCCQANGIVYTRKPIRLYINSYGGSVHAGFEAIGVIQTSATPVHTYVTGVAMSCGFLMAVAGSKRFGYRHGTWMYHQISSSPSGSLKELNEVMEEHKRLQAAIEDIVEETTRIPRSRLQEVFNQKLNWYMDAGEALLLGVIDHII